MDLKIKDVAELLNVSETTIRRWLSDGKIPAYRLNHQYRFSRIEIENWMMSCKVDHEKHLSFSQPEQIYPLPEDKKEPSISRSGTQQFGLYRAVNKGEVYMDIPGDTKEEVIKNTIEKVAKKFNFDAEVVSELFLDREKLMPTSLNNGIAVPHSRDFILRGHASDIVVVVFPKKAINYGALDGKPVHSMFFLFSSDDKKHLHLLAKIAHLSNNSESLALLEEKPSKESFLEFLKDWEVKLRT